MCGHNVLIRKVLPGHNALAYPVRILCLSQLLHFVSLLPDVCALCISLKYIVTITVVGSRMKHCGNFPFPEVQALYYYYA